MTLPTGERVRLSGAVGKERVLVDHVTAHGPGRTLLTHRLDSHLFVTPVVAEPYLGRFLDPNLFDVTSLQASTTASGRLPVRLAFRGGAPHAPGIHITSVSAGSARGYLTAESAATFGRALTEQWLSDSAAGWPQRSTMFGGVTQISADVPPPVRVTPHFPMYTLKVKTIGSDGKPQVDAAVLLLNVDDGRKYVGFVFVENGEARVSVPAGHYSAIGDDFNYDEETETGLLKITTVNEYVVTGRGQTLTIDHRHATRRPSVRTPRPATLLDEVFEWNRTDAQGEAAIGAGYLLDGSIDLAVAPAAKAKVGTVSLVQSWTLVQPKKAVPSYSYALASREDRIPAQLRYAFATKQLATVRAAYYGDGTAADAAFMRVPLFADGGGFGTFEPIRRATRRTEYVGAKGAAVWADSALINAESFDDPGFLDGPIRSIPAGSTSTVDWFRGPLAPAIPVQLSEGFCFGCRYGNTIGLFLAPVTDSDPTHIGGIFEAEDGLPVARFRWYVNGKLTSDRDDSVGGEFKVKAGRATYRAIVDVDRRLTRAAQSTRTQTELSFSSTKGKGKKLPSDWYCQASSCRVLPIVQARLHLPTDLKGRLPVGKSTVTVTVARAQNATAAAARSAKLEIRPEGNSWISVKVKAIGHNRYRGVINNEADTAGTFVDVRVGGSDRGGSTFSQTVLHAYTVAGSR